MPVPKIPACSQMPNNFNELLGIQRKYFRGLSEGLTNTTKVTKLNRVRSLATEKKAIANAKKVLENTKNVKAVSKVTDSLKKGAFSAVNKNLGRAIGFALQLASIGLHFLTIDHLGNIQESQIRVDGIQSRDLGIAFERAINNTLNLRKLRAEFEQLKSQVRTDISNIFAETSSLQTSITDVRNLSESTKRLFSERINIINTNIQNVGNSLIEFGSLFNNLQRDVSHNFKQLANRDVELAKRTNEAYKIGNDALYEVRAGRRILETKDADLQRQISLIDPRANLLNLSQQLTQIKIDINRALGTANKALQFKAQPGPQGPPGINGRNGINGKPGIDGKPGLNGRNGVDGKPGIQGRPGRDGKDGKDGRDGKDGKDMDQNQYQELLRRIALIPPLVARVPDQTVQKMPKPLNSTQVETAAGNAICKSTGPGGCIGKSLNNTSNTINQNTNNWGNKLLDKINVGANAGQLALLAQIDKKLGKQIPGGGISGLLENFSGRFSRFLEWKLLDRVLMLLTWWQTLHNAGMLSGKVVDTLIQGANNVIAIFGIKDVDGQTINIGEILGKAYKDLLIQVLGKETYENANKAWNAANRIYQSGANIIDSARSMIDSTRNVAEFAAENTGKIGNALMKFGVIGEKAFNWMPERVNAQSIWSRRLENLEEAASGIEMVTSEVLQVTENANQIKEQLEEFNKGIEELQPQDRKDNKPVKNREDADKLQSQSPSISQERERSA